MQIDINISIPLKLIVKFVTQSTKLNEIDWFKLLAERS